MLNVKASYLVKKMFWAFLSVVNIKIQTEYFVIILKVATRFEVLNKTDCIKTADLEFKVTATT